MTEAEARAKLRSAQVAHLATAGADGRPHVVPITFALAAPDTLVTAIDHKPKRTRRLKRLENIEQNPRAAVLADHYEDDWARLWWVRAEGTARIAEAVGEPALLDALVERYEPYRERRPEGPLIVVAVERWTGWP